MATAESSINEFPGDDDDDDSVNETNSSTTTVTEVSYSPQWKRKSNMKKIPNKHNKNNKSIVDNMQSNKQSSWCSSKLKISNEDPRSFHRSSSTRTPLNSLSIDESTHQTIFQSNQMPLASYSSSQFTSSEDFLNNNPFVNRLRNPSVAQKYGHSYFDTNKGSSTDSSRNANFETFFPESSTTADSFFDNLESREARKPSLEMESKYISEHRFHWSENIEYGSPWVRHRAKEIANHVNGLFEVKKKSEVSENDSKKTHKDLKSAEVVHEDRDEIDDDITYKIASKLCDTFLKHDETNVSDDQCPNYQCLNDEHFKWSKLYQKLINCGQL